MKKIEALEKEVQLLREKVTLLEKLKELQEAIRIAQPPMVEPIIVPVPYYPPPQPYWEPWYLPNTTNPYPQITWTSGAMGHSDSGEAH